MNDSQRRVCADCPAGGGLRPRCASFHKRHREYLERVQSGNILEVGKVYKTLFERSRQKDLGLKEKFLMERAEKMLLGELKYAKNITYEKAQAMVEKALTN